MGKNKKFEYKVLVEDGCANNFNDEAYLNKMGEEGWELVGVGVRTHGKPILYLKREKKTENKKPAYSYIPIQKAVRTERVSREEIKKRISEIIINILGVDESEVREEASFQNDLGADSLDAVELIMNFEKEFGVAILDDDAENVTIVGEAIDLLYKLIN